MHTVQMRGHMTIQHAAVVNQRYYDMPIFALVANSIVFIFRKGETPASLIVSEQYSRFN